MSRLTPAEYALRDVLIELVDVVTGVANDLDTLGEELAASGVSNVPPAGQHGPTLRLLTRRLYALPEALELDESPEVPRSREREEP